MNTIQKRIEEAAKVIAVKNAPVIGSRLYDECCYNSAMEMANFTLQNQWISVEDSLPVLLDKNSGQSEVVFAMTGYDNVFVAYYDYSNEHWYYNNHYGYDPQIYYEVTRWMPIPQN